MKSLISAASIFCDFSLSLSAWVANYEISDYLRDRLGPDAAAVCDVFEHPLLSLPPTTLPFFLVLLLFLFRAFVRNTCLFLSPIAVCTGSSENGSGLASDSVLLDPECHGRFRHALQTQSGERVVEAASFQRSAAIAPSASGSPSYWPPRSSWR